MFGDLEMLLGYHSTGLLSRLSRCLTTGNPLKQVKDFMPSANRLPLESFKQGTNINVIGLSF